MLSIVITTTIDDNTENFHHDLANGVFSDLKNLKVLVIDTDERKEEHVLEMVNCLRLLQNYSLIPIILDS